MNNDWIYTPGPEDPARTLLISVGAWSNQLHDEIWVYNQSFWRKDHGLWKEVQKANWKDVILKEEFKKTLQKDVYGFFASEAVYKELAIPWKVSRSFTAVTHSLKAPVAGLDYVRASRSAFSCFCMFAV